jgi:tripeptide aminopeptidase
MKTDYIKKNESKMVKTFLELAHINSPTYKEKKLATYLIKELKKLGCKVYVDGAGKKVGSDTGNVIAYLKGNIKSKPFLLATHMDTVLPNEKLKTIISKKEIKTDGKTILGADDKAGIAIVLQILRILKEEKLPHPPIEILFTTSEETGVYGSMNLEKSRLKSKYGVVIDNTHSTQLITKAPARMSLNIKITGKTAHSGVEPEKGISAADVFVKAMGLVKFGRIDSETTSNIGFIKGGVAINMVMPEMELQAEARSRKPAKLKALTLKIKKSFEKAAKMCGKKLNGKMVYPKVEFKSKLEFPHLSIAPNSPLIKQFQKSAAKYKLKMKLAASGGASDANLLYSYGIEAPNLGCGYRDAHTNQESLILKEFFDCGRIILDTILDFKY